MKEDSGPWAPPVLVWSMGKVASSSIYETIRACGAPAIHIHTLNDWDLAQAAHGCGPFSEPPENIRTSLRFRHGLSCQAFRFPISIVTIVRDPIARNISAFFENLGHARLEELGATQSDMLIQEFFDSYAHDVPALWFDREIREVTQLDVLDANSAVDESGLTYQNERYRLRVLRVGDSDEEMRGALETFLERPVPALLRANETHSKAYADLYAMFRNSISFPEAYLDAMYGSDYARRFWSEAELQAMRSRWKASEKFTCKPPNVQRPPSPVTVGQAFDAATWRFLISSGGVQESDAAGLLAALGPIASSSNLADLNAFWNQDREGAHGSCSLTVQFTLQEKIQRAIIGVPVFSSTGVLVGGFRPDPGEKGRPLEPGRHALTLHIPELPLSPGCYIPVLSIRDADADQFVFRKPVRPLFLAARGDRQSWGVMDVDSHWTHLRPTDAVSKPATRQKSRRTGR